MQSLIIIYQLSRSFLFSLKISSVFEEQVHHDAVINRENWSIINYTDVIISLHHVLRWRVI